MKVTYLISLLVCLLFASESFAQPVNEDCSNATLIVPSTSPSCNTVPGTFLGSALGTIPCESGNHQDVWYQFVATEEITEITVSGASFQDIGFEIIDGTCSGPSLFCEDNSGSSTGESLISDQFVIGNTYFIRVFNSYTSIGAYDFDICVESYPPPSNDNCSNAISISPSVSPTCLSVAGTFSGASLNTITCETGDHQDVWYQFVATEEITEITVSGASFQDIGFEIIDGTCSGPSLFCEDNSGSSTGESLISDQFVIGNTYFIRVFNSYDASIGAYDFDICVESYPPPSNDNCSNAILISPSVSPACLSVAGTFSGASLNTITCETGDHQDVWYQFVATEEITEIAVSGASFQDIGFEIIDGTCSGPSLFCEDNSGSSTGESLISDQFVIGNTYFIRVFNSYDVSIGAYDFDICVESYPPPSNDNCSSAISISPSVSPACLSVAGTFSGASLNTITCETGGHQDVWYQFIATATTSTISLSAVTFLDVGFEVIDGSCSGSSLFCVDNSGSSTGENNTFNQYVIGNTYYISVFNSYELILSSGNFDICVESLPVSTNDDCANAFSITPSISPICASVAGTFSGSALGVIPCETGDHQDVWFEFTASSAVNRISLSAESSLDHGFEVVEGNCAGASLFCVNNNGINFSESFTSDQYTVGSTYYVRVFNSLNNLSSLNFDICVESFPAPINDDCSNASTLTPGVNCTYMSGNFSGVSQNSINCESNIHQAVWYSFVATNDTMYIELGAANDLDHGFELMDACNGTSLSCTNDNGISLSELEEATNLVVGNTYYVRVYNANSGLSQSSFDICIYGDEDNTGLAENDFGDEIFLYPNPTTGNFTVDLGEIHRQVRITLLDLKGRSIETNLYDEGQLFNLKLEEPTGVYLLKVESEGKNAVMRLMKE